MSPTFALLVPVKTLTRAKSRLESGSGDGRAELMRAFALDAITAARDSVHVAAVHVVTDEAGFEVAGVNVLPDEGEGDLNACLRHAAVRVRLADPGTAVAAMCADLPSLRTGDLDTALAVGMSTRWFVADAVGSGTTLLAAGPGIDLDPHFGVGSADRHERSGAVPVRAEVASLRMDVDTGADLDRALGMGVGTHTSAVLENRR